MMVFAETGYWLWDDNSPTKYFNWWNSCYKVNGSCVAITYNQEDIPDGKWIPLPCDQRLPFLCIIKKGTLSHVCLKIGLYSNNF